MTPPGSPAVMLVAGEASGDLHGAALCRALRELDPQCRLFGMGGARMAAEGMNVLVDLTAKAATGGTEVFGQVRASIAPTASCARCSSPPIDPRCSS